MKELVQAPLEECEDRVLHARNRLADLGHHTHANTREDAVLTEGLTPLSSTDTPLPPLSEYREMLEETVEALRDAERRFLGIGMPASAGYARSAISKAEAFLSLNRGEKDGLQTNVEAQCGVASQAKLTGQPTTPISSRKGAS